MAKPIFDGLTIVEEAADATGWRAQVRVEPSSRAFAGHFDGHFIVGPQLLQKLSQLIQLPFPDHFFAGFISDTNHKAISMQIDSKVTFLHCFLRFRSFHHAE